MHPKVLLRSEKINKIEPTPPLPYQFDTIIYFDKKDPKYCPTLALRPESTWALRTHSILETHKSLMPSRNLGTRDTRGTFLSIA